MRGCKLYEKYATIVTFPNSNELLVIFFFFAYDCGYEFAFYSKKGVEPEYVKITKEVNIIMQLDS